MPQLKLYFEDFILKLGSLSHLCIVSLIVMKKTSQNIANRPNDWPNLLLKLNIKITLNLLMLKRY